MDKEKMQVIIGTLMRKYRKQKKVSVVEMGKVLGVTYQMISYYERGLTPITVIALETYCDYLGNIKYYQLLEEADKIYHNDQI